MMLEEKQFQLEVRKLLQTKTTDELEIIYKQCRKELECRIRK